MEGWGRSSGTSEQERGRNICGSPKKLLAGGKRSKQPGFACDGTHGSPPCVAGISRCHRPLWQLRRAHTSGRRAPVSENKRWGADMPPPFRAGSTAAFPSPPASDQTPPRHPAPSPLQHHSPGTCSVAPLLRTCAPAAAHPPALFWSIKPRHHVWRWPYRNPRRVPSPPSLPLTPAHAHRCLPGKAPPGCTGSLSHRSSPLIPQTHPNPLRALRGLAQRCLQMGLPAPSCPERPGSQQPAWFSCRIARRKTSNQAGLSILKIPGGPKATPGDHRPGTSPAALRGRLSSRPCAAQGCSDNQQWGC